MDPCIYKTIKGLKLSITCHITWTYRCSAWDHSWYSCESIEITLWVHQ